MAVEDLTGGSTPFDRAPAGLQQTRSSGITDLTGGVSPWLQPGWETGGQVGTTQNAFNDDFYDRMYAQYEQEQRKIEQDEKYASDLFLRDDFTGIVGWNQTFDKNGYFKGYNAFNRYTDDDGNRKFQVGDIYDNGEYLGNVYDKDSGLSLEEANGMVAPHIFGKDAADKYREANGDQEKLKELIQKQGAEQGKLVETYVTRKPYQDAVDNLLSDWDGGNVLDEVLIGATSALGGVAAGAAFGPWGMVIGGIAGLAGGLMNADEARTQAAQAVVSTGIVNEDLGGDAAAAHAIARLGELGMGRLNVAQNLAGGFVDFFSGNMGDNESELRRAASEGNVGAHIAMGVTGFADGLLQSSGKAGLAAYMTTMGMTVAGDAYNKATRDGQWDEVTGDFHKYESVEQRLAGWGATSIDVSQTVFPALLRNSAVTNIGGTKSVDLEDLAKPGARGNVTVMDRTFLVENQGGTLRAVEESVGRGIVAWMAPSTIVSRLSTRANAYGSVLRAGGTKVEVDDLYQAALRMENASVPWKLALVNGFGEAAEETLQTYLNAEAVGWNATPQEFLTAAIAGFSMGAGMSVGSRVGTVASDERGRFRANAMFISEGMPTVTRAEWMQLDPVIRRQLGMANKTARRMFAQAYKDFQADAAQTVIEATTLVGHKEDQIKSITKKSRVRLQARASR